MLYVMIGMAGFIIGWFACAMFTSGDGGGAG